MCGIVGIVNLDGRSFNTAERRTLDRLIDTLVERGPDGRGSHVHAEIGFGHHRLAIRDQDHGQQPWVSRDKNCVLVYNGELYNDESLRRELSTDYQFETLCDTEVVMAAYLRWGRSCVRRFRGMFALGLYDFRDQSLWLVRDRFGVKPLFFARLGNQFVFASRIATIVTHPGYSKQPDWQTISHYLSTTRLTMGPRSMYQGILQLESAEELIVKRGHVSKRKHWDYPIETGNISYADAADLLEEQLDAAVQSRLVSDVPVGMFLSGGVDSSTLASLVHRRDSSPRFATCAASVASEAATGDDEELSFANDCASEIGATLEPVHVNGNQYIERWHELVGAFRVPMSTPSDVMIFEIARAAKKHVGVVLGGEGSDELLCGYEVAHWSGHDYDAAQGPQRPGPSMVRSLLKQYGRSNFSSEADHYFALNSLMPSTAKSRVLADYIWDEATNDRAMFAHYQQLYDSYEDLPTVEKNAIVLHRVNLEALLARLDSTTMHAGLEARVPFTDHQLVESMFRLPFRYRIDVAHGTDLACYSSADLSAQGRLRPKRILRTVANRLLPPRLANRKKASFPTGVNQWFQREWIGWLSNYLAKSRFVHYLLNGSFREELIRAPQLAGMWLWPITNLAIWGDQEFFGTA